jgi:hypothetical protein
MPESASRRSQIIELKQTSNLLGFASQRSATDGEPESNGFE